MRPQPIASRRHTATVVLIFAGLGIAGSVVNRSGTLEAASPTGQQTLQMYLSALLIEWASVYYVWRGIRRHARLGSLIGGRWNRISDVALDIALAACVWLLWLGVQAWLPASTNDVSRLLPRDFLQAAAWIPVAVSAGICEEIVFRGYLQRQFYAFTGSLPAAIGAQALIFAFAHFYEGAWPVAKIIIYGALLGALAARRSLRPGMIAHTWSDLFGVVIFTR